MTLLFLISVTFIMLTGDVFATCTDGSTECGGSGICVPDVLTSLVSTIITIIKIGVPIILIVLGMIDMGKAVASQKEDEIKKGQKILLSRCIAAGIVFFVVAIVQLLFGIIGADDDNNSMWNCINKFVNKNQNSKSTGEYGKPEKTDRNEQIN